MKKLLSIFLAIVLSLAIVNIPTFALCTDNSNEQIDVRDEILDEVLLYREKFVEQYIQTAEGKYVGEDMLRDCYDEEYYHYDENRNIDWAMVSCSAITIPYPHYAIFGDRVIFGDEGMPLNFDMAVYDVALDKFIDIVDIEDISQYDGLEEYIAEFAYPLGDANMDRDLTILDATYIQRIEAQLVALPYDDLREYDSVRGGQLNYMSDIDKDGERTVLDATAIQRKLAQLD